MINNLVEKCLESIKILEECAFTMLKDIENNNFLNIKNLIQMSTQLLFAIEKECIDLQNNYFMDFKLNLDNLMFSLKNIFLLLIKKSQKIKIKIEFEYIPLLQEFYFIVFFYSHNINNEEEYKDYLNKYAELTDNKYLKNSSVNGNYKYDVSITVCAFNKLEYTKKCIDSIIKYTDESINYEIVLINNGSTDSTHSYFESLEIKKYINLKNNSMLSGAAGRITEGRYTCGISNDVVVTKNYLNNLLNCIKTDPKIIMVVPSTSNVSNLQAVNVQFKSFDEIQKYAQNYNVKNSYLWEQRTRLCNPITLFDMDLVIKNSDKLLLADKAFVHYEFHDDAVCTRIRRAGFKMILEKDCYCYHFGSVTLKESQVNNNTLKKSREIFYKLFGFDAWDIGFCYDINLFKNLKLNEFQNINILGINNGIGSNSLKIKELIHEKMHTKQITLYNVTDDPIYELDLKGISDLAYATKNKINFDKIFEGIFFQYIIFEDGIKKYNMKLEFQKLKNRLTEDGILIILESPIKGGQLVSSDLYKGKFWSIYKKQ